MAQSLPNKSRLLEKYIEVVRQDGLITNKNVNVGINGVSAALWVSGNISSGGVVSSTGGQTQAGTNQTTVFHSGGVAPTAAAAATAGTTNATPATTETYVCEVFIPDNATITGIAVLNGTAVAGHVNVALADSTGKVVAKSATNVSQSGATAYQQVPFTATYSAVGPAKYFILSQYDNTSARFISHTIGNFGATKVTSETYGTFLTTASYSTTTFTTAIGPVADTY